MLSSGTLLKRTLKRTVHTLEARCLLLERVVLFSSQHRQPHVTIQCSNNITLGLLQSQGAFARTFEEITDEITEEILDKKTNYARLILPPQ